MSVDCADGDIEPAGNFLGRPAFAAQPDDLELAAGHLRDIIHLLYIIDNLLQLGSIRLVLYRRHERQQLALHLVVLGQDSCLTASDDEHPP